MTLLLKASDMPTSFFNRQPDLHHYTAAETHTLATPARALCKIFEKHGLEMEVGVGLNHIHYPIDEGTCVVMRLTNDPKHPLATDVEPKSAELLPISWVWDGSSLIPVLFVHPTFLRVGEALDKLASKASLLIPDFIAALTELKLQKTLALSLRVLTSKELCSIDSTEVLVEVTHKSSKSQTFHYEPKTPGWKEVYLTTFWGFIKESDDAEPELGCHRCAPSWC